MRQTIFAIVLVGALLGGGFFAYRLFTGVPDASVLKSGGDLEKRLAEYRKIKILRLDLTMLSDPLLRSFSRPLLSGPAPAVTPGRKNPFAP